jgi:hypothetical protein
MTVGIQRSVLTVGSVWTIASEEVENGWDRRGQRTCPDTRGADVAQYPDGHMPRIAGVAVHLGDLGTATPPLRLKSAAKSSTC